MVDLEQAASRHRRRPELLDRSDLLHFEAGSREAVGHVGGIEANVVMLSEGPLALHLRHDARILVRALPGEVERHHHETPSVGGGDPAQLTHGGDVRFDVLENVRADDGVEAGIGEVKRREVELEIDSGLREIRGHVAEMIDRSQATAERPLRGEVEQRPGLPEKLRPVFEEEPLGPMALV